MNLETIELLTNIGKCLKNISTSLYLLEQRGRDLHDSTQNERFDGFYDFDVFPFDRETFFIESPGIEVPLPC